MRHRRHTALLLLLPALIVLGGCSREEIYCQVTLNVVMPGGETVSLLSIDPSVRGNFFRNINTLETYDFPLIAANRGRMTVLKGLYAISFDGVAELDSGVDRKVRFTDYSTEAHAVSLLEDQVELTLPLTVLK